MSVKIDKDLFYGLIDKYRVIQANFLREFGVNDIFSNSKIYEVMVANKLDHILIPGHSGSKDAKDRMGKIYEYKHFKSTSSNHSWTFNDFSDTTIDGLEKTGVVFAHIEDTGVLGHFDWYYEIDGSIVAEYLRRATLTIQNTRKMINVSSNQIERSMDGVKTYVEETIDGPYEEALREILDLSAEIEKCCGTRGVLTSNKLWEVMIGVSLDHIVNSEQGGRAGAHDASDEEGNTYEYKISINRSWNFQDISENVLNKYLRNHKIILAVIDKTNLKVKDIYEAEPVEVVRRLREKLEDKKTRFESQGKSIRRLQVSLSAGDLLDIKATKIV